MRRLDKHVGEHSKEEIKAEIEKKQEWAKEVNVIKIKEYTHFLKVEFGSVEAADMALERGILMFHMMVTPEQMTRDEFINILTCFRCYAMESHPTKNCTETKVICSECRQEGHRWSGCRNPNKRCLNCKGQHRTLAMACPIKKELINKKKSEKEQEKEQKRARPYSAVIKETIRESQTKARPTQIVLSCDHSYLITTCIIHAHFINLARPGSHEMELNKLLKSNGLPPIIIPTEVPSEELFGARVAENVRTAQSMESLKSQVSGFQEEGFSEMMDITTERDPRRQRRVEGESIYIVMSKEKHIRERSAQRPQTKESEEREEGIKTKPKEKRETKIHEIEAKNLGLKIYSSESNGFPKKKK